MDQSKETRVAPRPVGKHTAWACLVTNLCTVPGLGSLAAGRKVGLIQAPLAAAGFGLSLLWLIVYVRAWLATGEKPEGVGPHFEVGLIGVGLFATAWLWGLATGLKIHRQSTQVPPRI
jgi:F0F1-type ATP synthase membrane subunit c/vacuolar-type H+-ATPase subunit K